MAAVCQPLSTQFDRWQSPVYHTKHLSLGMVNNTMGGAAETYLNFCKQQLLLITQAWCSCTVLVCDDVLLTGRRLQRPPSRDQAPADDVTTTVTAACIATLCNSALSRTILLLARLFYFSPHRQHREQCSILATATDIVTQHALCVCVCCAKTAYINMSLGSRLVFSLTLIQLKFGWIKVKLTQQFSLSILSIFIK